jgi:hypothetical protein
VLAWSATPLLQDEVRDRLRRVVRHLRHHGDVGVGGEHDAGVPELVLDDLQIGPRLQREAAGAVPQIVQPDRRQPAGRDERVEGAGERVGADRLAVLAGEHIPAAIGIERGEFSTLALGYPQQEFQTDPEYISLKPGAGDRLGQLLLKDHALRQRMVELGFRVIDNTDTVGTRRLFQLLVSSGVQRPDERTDVTRAELPELNLLQRLVNRVGRCQ